MKNKIELKKTIIKVICIILIFIIIFTAFGLYQYRNYTNNFNNKIDGILNELVKKYPKINKNDLIKIINSDEVYDDNLLRQYGIDTRVDSIILKNEQNLKIYTSLNILGIIIFSTLIIIAFLNYNKSKDRKLQEIANYMEEINRKNYKLDIDDNTEDELSILKNEVYKITVMLKEQAENLQIDKLNLKDSISDISHQLKTPLTSIMIMLDNILDNPDMDQNTRKDFIRDIKRKITNINFLVQALLRLSALESNTVNFSERRVNVTDIINESIKNVSILCDLKDIKIEVNGNKEITIDCDIKWQIEALSNILKNSVEYSDISSKIIINYEKNDIFTEIKIIDNGKGMSENDMLHIFERFYKGENSSKDSIGIGLALSKSIIEKSGGNISVQSIKDKGTTFVIKYFQY